jgi:predicted alpha/beta-hydrolase family hydrolase
MIATIENNIANPIAQIIFAHGAGADMHHEFMEQVSALFNQAGINVLRFNFPYMDKRIALGKRYPPDRMPTLIECYKKIINDYLASNTNLPLFIGGKSMGSRVAATLASDENIINHIQGVFCLGYPFHPAKKIEKLRLEPLQNTKKPILIVQGERDTLGSEIEIIEYELSNLCNCIFLSDGDHSLKPRVKSGFTQLQHMKSAVLAIAQFIEEQSNNA